ncbi:transmembrane protein 117-like [Haliotis cracherodii]|uniref:transmembrane protein 117-like n=1 Tax=Haliotis cracherodii TaxID=6455 RepID=UPI0039EA01D3
MTGEGEVPQSGQEAKGVKTSPVVKSDINSETTPSRAQKEPDKDDDPEKPKLSVVKDSEVIQVDIPNEDKDMKPKKTDQEDIEQEQPLKSPEAETPAKPAERVVAPIANFESIELDDEQDDEQDESDKNGTKEENGTTKPEDTVVKSKRSGTDEVDAASVYSLFMERDFRYYFQHPYCRLFVAYFVTFCNFLIYAEDPVAHSRKECSIPVIGNDFAFVCTRYPSNAWSLLKVFLWIVAIIIGCIVGKLLFHELIFNRLFKLKLFSSNQGSWMTMFFCVILCLFIISWLYNGFLMIGGDATEPYRISSLMGISNSFFTKAAACGTWCGDFFTAWMVTDIMLQEKLYPSWAPKVRAWWIRQYHRIILFWVITSCTSFIVIFVIATDYISWDKLNRDFLHTNELSRSFLASFILVMDMIIVMQDWDFPHFISAIDIKLPGLNTAHIKFQIPIPKILRKEYYQVHITGKWFNYGVLFLVLLLDLNMWKNQMFYQPKDFGQYVDSEGKIHTITDTYSLDTFNATQLVFDFRNSTINPATNMTYISGDNKMNTRFYDYHLAGKCMAFLPSLTVFIMFGFFIYKYGRFRPTKEDPYAGRLKKRKKRRFSARFHWRRLRNRIRTAEPILMYFRKRGPEPSPAQKTEESYAQNWELPAS